MAKSSHRLSPNGSKLYALFQLAHFIGPTTANEIASHLNAVLRNGLSANQCANHLRRHPKCDISLLRQSHDGGGSALGLYYLREPENPNIHQSKRRIDRYILDLIEEAEE